jgi:hypothetical protein
VLAAVSGCGHADDSNAQSEARLSKLGLSYALLAGNNSGTPPSRVEELRHYLEQATSKAQLKAMGVTDAGEMFISPRDGKPYKMIALPRLPPPAAGQPPPVVLYEQVGWQGKRYVAYLGGGVEEVDVDKFQQLVPRPE